MKRQTVLIIAHPDDECMFFYPTVRHLTTTPGDIYVLCLSTGNAGPHYLGERRTTELKHSCSVMGVPWSHVRVIDDVRLQDGMQNTWEPGVIAAVVSRAIDEFSLSWSDQSILNIVTFDAYGVSNHINHRSVCHGVRHWYEYQKQGRAQDDADVSIVPFPRIEVFELHSVTLLVKYMGLLSWLVEPLLWQVSRLSSWQSPRRDSIVLRNLDVARVWRAMACHASQLTWWRVLFVFFSQYSTYNRLYRWNGQI